MTTVNPDTLPAVSPTLPSVKYEMRMGVLYPYSVSPHYFTTTAERWEQDAAIYLRYGEATGQDRNVWLETRTLIITDWAGGL